jgi:3-deoxy-D-manno-octulosonate 8-phosphate phosphatase (KDO 8-P phosphatase)
MQQMAQADVFSQIQLLILEVDGVLTDGRTRQDEKGHWRRVFSIRDSIGIRALRKAGVRVAFLTQAQAVEIRDHAAMLGIDELIEDCSDKSAEIENLARRLDLRPEQILFMTDCVHDIEVFRKVGCSVVVASAQVPLKKAATYITRAVGGDAAVLEICNQVMQSNENLKVSTRARSRTVPGARRAAV